MTLLSGVLSAYVVRVSVFSFTLYAFNAKARGHSFIYLSLVLSFVIRSVSLRKHLVFSLLGLFSHYNSVACDFIIGNLQKSSRESLLWYPQNGME